MSNSFMRAFARNFLGNAPGWYKWTIIAFLIADPILFYTIGPFISGLRIV